MPLTGEGRIVADAASGKAPCNTERSLAISASLAWAGPARAAMNKTAAALGNMIYLWSMEGSRW
jgi:hypothetical protein